MWPFQLNHGHPICRNEGMFEKWPLKSIVYYKKLNFNFLGFLEMLETIEEGSVRLADIYGGNVVRFPFQSNI